MAATRTRAALWLRDLLTSLIAAVVGMLTGSARAETSIDFKMLFYGEGDDRTQVWNPELALGHDFGKQGQVGLFLGYDSISGASPTGELPTLDATTSASGSAASGDIPMAEFSDTRRAATASYTRRFGTHLPAVDLSYSRETDYRSRGLGLTDSWELFDRTSTLHVGVGWLRDDVEPVNMTEKFDKRSTALSAGWTQILGARDLIDLSVSLTDLSGYLNDPYKLVPVGAATVPEIRPDSRSRHVVMVKYGHHFLSRGALKVSYRWYGDDWSVRAHTVELVHDQRVGERWIVTPELRLYTQGAASFFAYEFAEPQTYMSSDYRLSSFSSWRAGLGGSYQVNPQLSVNVAGGFLRQTGDDRVLPRGTTPVAPFGGDDDDDDDGDDDGGGPASLSPADLDQLTLTAGFSYRF